MKTFTYQANPARIVFGAGALRELPAEVERLGAKRALVLSTPEQVASAECVASLLGERTAGIFARAVMHVPIETARAARDEALQIANGTEYGLGSGLWTANLPRAHRFARDLRAGMVWINSYKRVSPGSPFGGVGSSGYGREMGYEAMREYTEPKAVWVNIDAQLPAFYARG